MEAKRNISELENLPQNTGRKVLFTTNYQCENILLPYYHHTSPLLTPKDDLILNFEGVFVMRAIRPIQGYHKITLPIFQEEEYHALLHELLEQYKKDPNPLNQEKSLLPPPKKSKKEETLSEAASLLEENIYSQKQISQLTGLKLTQIQSLSKRLETTGQVLPFSQKRRSKLTEQQIDFLTSLLTSPNGCILTLEQLRQELLNTFPQLQQISLKTISNTLKNKGFSFKKISPIIDRRNFLINKQDQKKVSQQLITIFSQQYSIIFVDETGIKLNSHPRYGWGKKGQKLSLEVEADKNNYSIMAAITDREILGCQIIEEGGTRKEDFLGFLCTVINQCCQPGHLKEILVFLDNSTAHKANHVRDHLGQKVTFIWNASYTPMLNPIEEFFAKFKAIIKRKLVKNSSQLITAVQQALTSFTPQDFKGYIRHTLKYAQAALSDQNLV